MTPERLYLALIATLVIARFVFVTFTLLRSKP